MSAIDQAALDLASEWRVVGVRREASGTFLDCYEVELPEDGFVDEMPAQTFAVTEDGELTLASPLAS